MNKQKSKIVFFLAALLWGASYAFQKPLLTFIDPISFTFWNFLFSGIVFLVYALIKKIPLTYRWREGIILGIFLSGMEIFEMIGLNHTSSANTVFLTNLGMLIIPYVSFLIYKKKIKFEDNIAILLAIAGMYMLVGGLTGFKYGDGIVLISALASAFYFIYSERFEGEKSHYITTLCIQQFFIISIICAIWCMFSNISLTVVPEIRLTVLWQTIAFTTIPFVIIQWACKWADEMIATIYDGVIEPLTGAIFSWIIFLEATTKIQMLGGLIMIFSFVFAAVFSKRHYLGHFFLQTFKK